MIRCPQTQHFSAVCWKPEYWKKWKQNISTQLHSYLCIQRFTMSLQCMHHFFFRISHVFRRDNMNSCLYLCIWRMGRYWSECWYFPIVHNYLCNLLPLPCYMYIYIIVFGHNSSTKTSMFANSRHLMHKMCSNSSHVQLLIELIGINWNVSDMGRLETGMWPTKSINLRTQQQLLCNNYLLSDAIKLSPEQVTPGKNSTPIVVHSPTV